MSAAPTTTSTREPGVLSPRAAAAVTAMLLGVAAVTVTVAPLHVVVGVGRLVAWTVAAAGAWLVVGRVGAVDLALAASLAAGAATAVMFADLDVPVGFALLAAPLAGAAVGAGSGALAGRLGRAAGAVATLAFGLGLVAVLGTVLPGGAAGFHAVPLLLGDRGDALLAVLGLAVAVAAITRAARSVPIASASVAARSPSTLLALGHRPAGATAVAGAVGGAALGLAGALQAVLSGSVVPGGFGLATTAALALAALLGGAAPLGPVLGAALVWGPGILFPLAPGVGTAPTLLVIGPVGLAFLAARRGRPVLPWRADAPSGGSRRGGRDTGDRRPGLRSPHDPTEALEVDGLHGVTFSAGPGEVIALVGPNGAGKSTLLAKIGGQLPDGGVVRLGGAPLPAGPLARARAGVARTWQHPPDVDAEDLLAAGGAGSDIGVGTAGQADPEVGTGSATDPRDATWMAHAQLLVVAAQHPRVALLDEPDLPIGDLEHHLATLRAMGAVVVVVDHRGDVQHLADRTIHLERGDSDGRHASERSTGPAVDVPVADAGTARLEVVVGDQNWRLEASAVHLAEGSDGDLLMDALTGRIDASITVDGRSVDPARPGHRVRRGLVVVEDAEVADDVTVRDHFAAVVGPRRADALIASVDLLAGRGGDRAGVLSGGERRMLAASLALAQRPRVLVVDRIGHGLDGDSLTSLGHRFEAARQAGATLVVRPARAEEVRWAQISKG